MDLGIKGKLALVTGATRGLGRAAALALGEEGCRLAIVARDSDALTKTIADLKGKNIEAFGCTADLTDKTSIVDALRKIVAECGAPEILVYNNAGARDHFFDQAEDDDFLHAYSILVMGFVWCVREVLPDMKKRGWGRIVTLGSLCAKEPHKQYPLVLHNLGRPAQVGLSKTLSNELGRFGITVNTIGTGMIDHDGQSVQRAYATAAEKGLSMDDVNAFRIANIPVGRAGRPDELGSLCAFLCSDRAAFITGQTILIDGGRVAALM